METIKRIFQNTFLIALIYGFTALVSVWIVRILWQLWLYQWRIAFDWILIVCPSQVFVIIMGITAIAAFFAYSHEKTESRLPAGIMILAIITAFQLPILPSTPEEWHFQQHQEEYEHIVELVTQGQFTNDINIECSIIKYGQLHGYTINSQEFCLREWEQQPFIEFYPFNSLHTLIYVIEPKPLLNPCEYIPIEGGFLESQINYHWFVCRVDWWSH